MKIETKENDPNVFKPVELKIIFETAEELDSFRNMCQLTMGVSNLVERTRIYNKSMFSQKCLRNMLDKIFHSLHWSTK